MPGNQPPSGSAAWLRLVSNALSWARGEVLEIGSGRASTFRTTRLLLLMCGRSIVRAVDPAAVGRGRRAPGG